MELYFESSRIQRQSEIIRHTLRYIKNTNMPLPSLVEISDSGTCNRVCGFCPRSDLNYKNIKKFISEDLHQSICRQLSKYEYCGMLKYSGFSEPLLNKQIYHNISVARSYLPNCIIELNTNGDVLNKKRLQKLFDSGLSTILISVYDGKEDEEKFIKLCNSLGLKEEQFLIRNRYLPSEQNFGLNLSNRGGMLKDAMHSIKPLEKSLSRPCYYPSYNFFVDYNGDVLMCCHEWGKKNILGNLNNQSFYDIWTSQLAKLSRKSLVKGNRNFSPCDVCDVDGMRIGKTHAEAWKKTYKE